MNTRIWQATFVDPSNPPIQIMSTNEQHARFAINTYFSEVLKLKPPQYQCVPFLPLLITDGTRVDLLAADNSGEYVGIR